MDAKQFAWAYLIRGGKCNVKPGYYGGFEHMSHMKIPKHASPHAKEWNDPYLAEVKEFGVDWEKTKSPRGDDYYTFQGTECDSGREEKLTGTLGNHTILARRPSTI